MNPVTNMLGIDVSGLDVPAFVAWSHPLFVLACLAFLALLLRLRSAKLLLLGVVLANAWTWWVTDYPLQRIYGLGVSRDRTINLAWCQAVAAGGSPIRTHQVGQLHFEPFWGVLVAFLSGFSPDRVLRLYPFLPLLVACAFVVSLYWGLGARGEDGSSSSWPPWERALAVGFATLLSTSSMDFAGIYRAPWVMTFLLKPNHALGLVLFPLVLRAFVGIRSWRGRIAVGLLVQLLGWVFVLHMAYVCAGLACFAVLSLLGRRRDAGRDALDVAVVIGVNAVVVSPYLLLLFLGFPFLTPSPVQTIAVTSPHLLETTLRLGPVFFLGLWGVRVAWRRGDRLGRIWCGQVLGAFLIWILYLALSVLQLARERDEIYYWIRFLLAASAGIGAWDLAGRSARWLGALRDPAPRAAAVTLLALPFLLPCWWDPVRMDSYFSDCLAPVPEPLRRATDLLRHETDPRSVLAGDREFARWAGALGARRVLHAIGHRPKDFRARDLVEYEILSQDDPARVRAAAGRYGVSHLAITREVLSWYPGLTLEAIESRPHMKRLFLDGDPHGEFLALYAIEGAVLR
jgi:hypothetical protein